MAFRTKEALENNQGDTHFVAILISIVVVVVLSLVYKEQMSELFNGIYTKVKALVDSLF